MVSDVLKEFGTSESASDVLLGVIGEGPALEFLSFMEGALREEDIKKILENPTKAALPKDLGDMYALVSYVGSRAKDKKVRQAAGDLLHRVDPEFGVLLVRDIEKKKDEPPKGKIRKQEVYVVEETSNYSRITKGIKAGDQVVVTAPAGDTIYNIKKVK